MTIEENVCDVNGFVDMFSCIGWNISGFDFILLGIVMLVVFVIIFQKAHITLGLALMLGGLLLYGFANTIGGFFVNIYYAAIFVLAGLIAFAILKLGRS